MVHAVGLSGEAQAERKPNDAQPFASVLEERFVARPGTGWWAGAPDCQGAQGLDPLTVTDLGLAADPSCRPPGATHPLSRAKVEALPRVDDATVRRSVGATDAGLDFRMSLLRFEASGGPLAPWGAEPRPGAEVTPAAGLATVAGGADAFDARVLVEAWPSA